MPPVETVLRDELARADRALGSVAPVLGHVLASSGHAMVSDAMVARIRGMLKDLSRQFLAHLPNLDEIAAGSRTDPVDVLTEHLADDALLLNYLHSVAVEAILTQRLEQRASIDPVLSPLWQELIASSDPLTAETAMQALAAQSRFVQAQRRMQHPVAEMPPEVLERALRILARVTPVANETGVTQALRALKSEYDEASSREGVIARLVTALRGGAIAALELEHAGFALFASALADRTGQSRDKAVLACHDHQTARLALSLRAAGLDETAIERQFLTLEPAEHPPQGLADLSADAARALLHQPFAAAEAAG